MKTKPDSYKRVNVITLGCSKNLVDSEVMMGQLRAGGVDVVHESEEDHEVVVVNTCGFIDNAKQESIDTILHYAKLRKEGRVKRLVVTGCLSERYKPELEKEIGDVDEFFGTRDLPALLRSFNVNYRHELVGERVLSNPSHFAYLKISEGCDRPCSFCAIPLMRGKHVSRSIEDVLAEAEKLASNGTKELLIIAQDSTYYGLDLYGKRELSNLLDRLSDVNGIEWIRLHYAFPSGFPVDVLDVIRERKNICNYLDIPLQHISDDMLRSMRRGTTRERTYKLLELIREKVPGIALRTSLISGYPGESEKDHDELLKFVSDIRFDRLGVFEYSHEENTNAFRLKDDVEPGRKSSRMQEIMELQQEISSELNLEKVGKVFKVLVDRKEGDYFIGRTESDSPEVDNEVLISADDRYLRIGDFTDVQITSSGEFDLYGIPASS
jgi:ribosomal protein S12 methylthiotransferase